MDFVSSTDETYVHIKAGGYSSEDGIVSRQMIMDKVDDAVVQHQKKMGWLSEEENRENRSKSKHKCWYRCACAVQTITISTPGMRPRKSQYLL